MLQFYISHRGDPAFPVGRHLGDPRATTAPPAALNSPVKLLLCILGLAPNPSEAPSLGRGTPI